MSKDLLNWCNEFFSNTHQGGCSLPVFILLFVGVIKRDLDGKNAKCYSSTASSAYSVALLLTAQTLQSAIALQLPEQML